MSLAQGLSQICYLCLVTLYSSCCWANNLTKQLKGMRGRFFFGLQFEGCSLSGWQADSYTAVGTYRWASLLPFHMLVNTKQRKPEMGLGYEAFRPVPVTYIPLLASPPKTVRLVGCQMSPWETFHTQAVRGGNLAGGSSCF